MQTGTVRPIFNTYLSEWLDNLQGYNPWEGSDELLELYRLMWESTNYYSMIVPFPTNIIASGGGTGPGNLLNFNAGETQTGAIVVPAYSYLLSIGGYAKSSNAEIGTKAPFKFKLYDKGAKTDLFYSNFAINFNGSSSGQNDYAFAANYPFGPYLLTSPLIVLPPGILQIEITNLDNANAATIQMRFDFAVPINSQNTNTVVQGPSK